MKHVSRRSVTTGIIAAVTAIPAGLSIGATKATRVDGVATEDKLLGIIRRYEASVDETNAQCELRGMKDDELDARIDRSCEILANVVGLPAATAADALAALNFVIRENIEENGLHPDGFPFDAAIASLLASVRGYIASTAEVRS